MIATHLGFYNTASSRTHVRLQFSTHAAAGGNVAPNSAFEAADIRIYRANDGAAFSSTQRSSANGITMTSPFDSLTGFHDVDIDLTDNTDAGFYAAGYLYSVVLAPDETVDSQTLTGVVLAYFEIGVAKADVTQFGGTAGTFASGIPEVKVASLAANAITATSIASDAITDAKVAADVTIASVTGAVGSVTGNVGGNVAGSVGSIASGGITAASIAADAITAAKIADGAIDAATFAAGAITATVIATGAIDADAIADNAIDAGAIAADAITNAKIADGAISAGKLAADTITAAKVAADVTTEIQSGLATAANLSTVAGYLDTEIAAILALLDDARGEPGQGAPPVNPDLATKIDYLYKAFRNKVTQTATELKIYADDGSTVDHKATVSDDSTTYTRGELGTGA